MIKGGKLNLILDKLEIGAFREGDKTVVEHSDGRKAVYIFVEDNPIEGGFVLTPNGEEVLKRIKEIK